MIQVFDKQTAPLNDYEQHTLLPVIIRGLREKVGIRNRVTSTKIVAGMRKAGYKLDDVRLRKIINYIRNNELIPCLASSGKGYFIATSSQEIDACIASIQGRINSHKALIAALQQQKQKYFN